MPACRPTSVVTLPAASRRHVLPAFSHLSASYLLVGSVDSSSYETLRQAPGARAWVSPLFTARYAHPLALAT